MGSIYRTQGKWKNIDFLHFKSHPKISSDKLTSNEWLDISKIYVHVEALEEMGFNFPQHAQHLQQQQQQQESCISGSGIINKPFYKFLDFLIQNPTSNIALDVFSGFFDNFEETETREVSCDIDFSETLIDGIDVKTEDSKYGTPVDEAKENDILDVKVEVDIDEEFIYEAYSDDDEKDKDYVMYNTQKKKKRKSKKENHFDKFIRDKNLEKKVTENSDTKFEMNHEISESMGNFVEKSSNINKKEYSKTSFLFFDNRIHPPGSTTSAEKRFVSRCEEFKKSTNLSEYYSYNAQFGSITCLLCSQVLTSKIQQPSNLRIHLIEKIVDHILVQHFQTYAYKCDDCQSQFQSGAQQAAHMKRCCQSSDIPSFKCKLCGERFSKETDLKTHVSSSHDALSVELLICNQCGLMFKTEKCKITHEKKLHGIEASRSKKKRKRDPNLPNGGAPRVICPSCGIEVCTKWVLEKHMKTLHENAFSEPKICHLCKDKEKEKSIYCRRKFFTPYALDQHLKLYHKDGPESTSSICHYCSEEFRGAPGTVNKELKTHIEKVHLGIRYNCDECGKVFMTSKTLSSHQKHVHRQEGRYPCKECGKIFKYTLQAIEHAYKDRGEAPHQCKNCDFKSPHSWALAKHKPLCRFS